MVSGGTVLTIGIVGAIAAVGVGLYAARGQIGGALARGVTQSISDPFRNYFENLFRGSTGGGNGSGNGGAGVSSIAGETVNGVEIPADTTVTPSGTVTSATPPILLPTPQAALVKSQTQKVSDYLSKLFGAFSASAQVQLLQEGAAIPTKTQFPAKEGLTNVINLALKSVGGTDPKLYQLKTLGGQIWGGTSPQPLSQEAVQYYAGVGVIAHEIYL